MDKLHVLLFAVLVQSATALKHVDVKLVYFNNFGHKKWEGVNCDVLLDYYCEPMFTICLDLVESGTQDPEQCIYPITSRKSGELEDTRHDPQYIANDTMIGDMPNPIRATTCQVGPIAIKILVEDYDHNASEGGDETMDLMYYQLNQTLTYNGVVNNWTDARLVGQRTRVNASELDIQYRLYCAQGYYGEECETYCVPTDDVIMGHYTCDDEGNKECLPGWETPEADCLVFEDDCASSPCVNGATCEDGYRNFTCHCPTGFKGSLCQTQYGNCDADPCVHGNCTNVDGGFYCSCEYGFTGLACNLPACPDGYYGNDCEFMDTCHKMACENGGTCSAVCLCPPGLTGTRCEIEMTTTDWPQVTESGPQHVCDDCSWAVPGFAVMTCLFVVSALINILFFYRMYKAKSLMNGLSSPYRAPPHVMFTNSDSPRMSRVDLQVPSSDEKEHSTNGV